MTVTTTQTILDVRDNWGRSDQVRTSTHPHPHFFWEQRGINKVAQETGRPKENSLNDASLVPGSSAYKSKKKRKVF